MFMVQKEQFAMLPILLPHNSWCGFKPQSRYESSVRRCRKGQSLVRQPRTVQPLSPQPEKIMKMNHMQSNSNPTATESMFGRALKRFACICAAGTLLFTSSSSWAVGANNVASPEATPPVPLIRQGSIQVTLATVVSGLTAPLELTSPADGTGRLFIVQQTGQILILEDGTILPTPFLDVADRLV